MTYNEINPERIAPVAWVGLSYPLIGDISSVTATIPGRPGVVYGGHAYGGKRIQVTFAVLGGPRLIPETVDALNAWAWAEELKPLRVDDRGYYRASLVSADDVSMEYGARLAYTFLAPDGLKYGPERSAALHNGSVTLYRGGSAAPGWTLDYTLTQQAAELFWRNGTHRIALTGDFAAGSSVHIDAGAELVEINGYNAMRYLTYDSRFFSLAPGENTVYGPGGTITYQEAWL